MPYVVCVEGSRDVSTLCAELMVKLHRSSLFEGVTWIPRTDDAPVGVESERSKALMRCVARYEFDVALSRRIAQAEPRHLFILSGLYDVGFWRRASEAGVRPNIVWYVESVVPTQDKRHASFVRFVRGLELTYVRFVQNSDVTVLNMITDVLDLVHGPNVANV